MNDDLHYTYFVGSGNVFADLGLADPEEALIKASIAHQIGEMIAHRNWTQAHAAKVLGVDQPSVSALLRGYLHGFSTDQLRRFRNALDDTATNSLTPMAPSRPQTGIQESTDAASVTG